MFHGKTQRYIKNSYKRKAGLLFMYFFKIQYQTCLKLINTYFNYSKRPSYSLFF